jgi:hypothetical protein
MPESAAFAYKRASSGRRHSPVEIQQILFDPLLAL